MGTSHNILLDEKYFWIPFHDDNIALLIKASLQASVPYIVVFEILTFKNPSEEQDVSYLWDSEGNVNQLLKSDGRSKLIDLLIKTYFQ